MFINFKSEKTKSNSDEKRIGWGNTRKFLNPAGSGIPGIFGSGNFGFRVRTNFQFTLQKRAILDFGSNFEAKRRISTYFGFLLHLTLY